MTIKELIAGRKSPKVLTHFGKGQVVSEKELRKASCGIGFDLPAEPDYEALATAKSPDQGCTRPSIAAEPASSQRRRPPCSISIWRRSKKLTAATSRRSQPPTRRSFT